MVFRASTYTLHSRVTPHPDFTRYFMVIGCKSSHRVFVLLGEPVPLRLLGKSRTALSFPILSCVSTYPLSLVSPYHFVFSLDLDGDCFIVC